MTRERSSGWVSLGHALETPSNGTGADAGAAPGNGPLRSDRLVMSVPEAATALGVSDDLLYQVVARGELPSLRFGRRLVIPRRAVELLLESAVEGFDPSPALSTLTGGRGPGAGSRDSGKRGSEDQPGPARSNPLSVPLYMGASTSSTCPGRSSIR